MGGARKYLPIHGRKQQGGQMSATLAISIAVLTIGSCIASYYLGRDSYRNEIRDFQERRRRWEEFDDED
jgi:hypothetical protein